MAPKSAEKEAKASPAKKEAAEGAEAKASPAKGSPAKAGAAAASPAAKGSAGKTRAASPTKEKTPAKKAKAEAEAEAEEAEEAEEALAVAAAGDAPAAHTRSKEGGVPTSAAKATAAGAAAGGLPQITITDLLLVDHRDTVALMKRIDEVSGDKLMMEKLTDAIALTVRLHSQAEMDVLYPLMEKRLGDKRGPEARQRSAAEHAKLEEDLLKALEQRKSGSEELLETIKEVMEAFVAHLKEEEEELVPLMLKTMSEEEQVEVAQSFMAAKAKAPLMPQPEAAQAMAGEEEVA